MGHSRPLFLYFSSFQYTVDSIQIFNINKILPMTGFEPRMSGIGSNRSTNRATTTSQKLLNFAEVAKFCKNGLNAHIIYTWES